MNCPLCEADSAVIDSRPWDGLFIIRRRRSCNGCGFRWTTVEIMDGWFAKLRKLEKSAKTMAETLQG